ncbi:2-oxoglutarate ferredoxin oxidoreductase subunit alpha, partial [Streptomyces sp. NPDC051567]
MTSQVSSPAEQADPDGTEGTEGTEGAAVSGQRTPEGPAEQGTRGGKEVRRLDRVVIRFAGDSGDGMQLTGDRF